MTFLLAHYTPKTTSKLYSLSPSERIILLVEYGPNLEAPGDGRRIAEHVREFGEEFGFGEQTCQEISQMIFVEAYKTTYRKLVRVGLNPKEILAPFRKEMEASHQIDSEGMMSELMESVRKAKEGGH